MWSLRRELPCLRALTSERTHCTAAEAHQERVELVPYQHLAEQHMADLRQRYGHQGAQTIRQLETAVMARFDSHVHARQPTMWPSMPLKL